MSKVQKFLRVLPVIGIGFFFVLVFYGFHLGVFRSPTALQHFIRQFGEWGVIVFITLQIVQVLVPILPGGVSSVAGMLLFGNLYGLLYSYIGLVIGEVLGFLFVRHYGRPFVQRILSPKKYQEFDKLLLVGDARIQRLLVITMLVPFAPDDLVCLVAGMTTITFRSFLQILLLLKPWSIGVYSFIMLYLVEKVSTL